jgi:hypothetical protein
MGKRLLGIVCLFAVCLTLFSCGKNISTLELATDVSRHFDFKYGAVYSDEYGEWHEFCFSNEIYIKVFGENAGKYTYIKSVSGYFSRDMISGSEFVAVELNDRSHRAEIMALLYRRASMRSDTDARVFCEGNFVFLVCDANAEEISRYIKSKI